MTTFEKTNLPEEAILIMLSGGIDSTYALFKYLTETDLPLHAHHISMQVWEESRDAPEDVAARKVTNFCGGYRSFSHSHSDYGFELPYTGWDTDVQLLMAARVAANLEAHRVTLVLGINADDVAREEIKERMSRNVIQNLWEAQIASIDPERRGRINPKIHLPFDGVAKAQMVKELPTGLFKMTWSCRKPVVDGDNHTPCGECHACVAKAQAIQKCGKA